MKTYQGVRTGPHGGDVRITVDGRPLPHLVPHGRRSHHSPTGFEWGYAGSGPADLAYAILADILGPGPRAGALYQHFKVVFITPADEVGFSLSETEIRAWLALQPAEEPDPWAALGGEDDAEQEQRERVFQCDRCGRGLRSERSQLAHYGPVCLAKVTHTQTV